eukprot:scaffold192918_cov46-Prasinocladus_malaysianus.AAC.1
MATSAQVTGTMGIASHSSDIRSDARSSEMVMAWPSTRAISRVNHGEERSCSGGYLSMHASRAMAPAADKTMCKGIPCKGPQSDSVS